MSTITEARQQVKEFDKDVKDCSLTLTMFFLLAIRVTGILRRLGLPENMVQAINVITRLILITRMLRASLVALELATPYGWIKGILGIGTTALIVGDAMMELNGG